MQSQRWFEILWEAAGVTPRKRTPYQHGFAVWPGHPDVGNVTELIEQGLLCRRKEAVPPISAIYICTLAGQRLAMASLPPPPPEHIADPEYLEALWFMLRMSPADSTWDPDERMPSCLDDLLYLGLVEKCVLPKGFYIRGECVTVYRCTLQGRKVARDALKEVAK